MGTGGSKGNELVMGRRFYRMERLVGKGSYGRVHSILVCGVLLVVVFVGIF